MLADMALFVARETHTPLPEVRRMPLRDVLRTNAGLSLSYQREIDARKKAA